MVFNKVTEDVLPESTTTLLVSPVMDVENYISIPVPITSPYVVPRLGYVIAGILITRQPDYGNASYMTVDNYTASSCSCTGPWVGSHLRFSWVSPLVSEGSKVQLLANPAYINLGSSWTYAYFIPAKTS